MGRGFVSRILIGVATPTEPKIFANGELWRTPIHERRKHERHKMGCMSPFRPLFKSLSQWWEKDFDGFAPLRPRLEKLVLSLSRGGGG